MDGATPSDALFAPAHRGGRFVYVSGVRAGRGPGATEAGDVRAQSRQALETLAERLKAAGSSLDNAASLTVYLKNAADFAAMNDVYRGFWSKDPPARTTVVTGLAEPEALVEIACIGIPTGGERRVIHPADWIKSPNPYSYGILSGDTLFLSGLVPRNGKDNSTVDGDIKTQTRAALDNGGAILQAAGMTHADVASARIYITDAATFQEMNETYRTYFAKDPPARATVRADLMNPLYRVEITLTAVKAKREALTTPLADGSPGPVNPNLSSAIRVGGRLYVSGLLGNNEANKGDAVAQTREIAARLGRALAAAGFAWSDLTDAVVYVTDAGHRAAVGREWQTHSKSAPMAGVVSEVGLMSPGAVVEIMAVAAKR